MSRRTKAHLVALGAYVALTPVAFVLGWLESVAFVALLSIWALVESRWATLEASRAKDAVDDED